MSYRDINCYIGRPPNLDGSARARRDYLPSPTADNLVGEFHRAGIDSGVVWHYAQIAGSAQDGNRLIAEAIAAHANLFGCWSILPECTGEMPARPAIFREMARSKIKTIKLSPRNHRYVADRATLGPLLGEVTERKIPVLLSVQKDLDWNQLHDLMADFPDLTTVCMDHGCWGEDRYFRPLLERYPNFAVDTSNYLLDGGIKALVDSYGYERILFGSGYPELYPGGMMLAIQHAGLSEEATKQIAGGNLERMLEEVCLD